LLSRNLGTNVVPYALNIRVADVTVRIEAPERVLAVLEATLSFVPRAEGAEPGAAAAQCPGPVAGVLGADVLADHVDAEGVGRLPKKLAAPSVLVEASDLLVVVDVLDEPVVVILEARNAQRRVSYTISLTAHLLASKRKFPCLRELQGTPVWGST